MTAELGERLLRAGLTSDAMLAHARAGGDVSGGGLLARLHDEGLAEEDLVGLFAAEGHGAALDAEDLAIADPALIERLAGDRAHALVALPLRADAAQVFVAMADPTDEAAREELVQTFGVSVEPMLARIGPLRDALQAAHPDYAPVAEVPVELVRRRESSPAEAPAPPLRPSAVPAASPAVSSLPSPLATSAPGPAEETRPSAPASAPSSPSMISPAAASWSAPGLRSLDELSADGNTPGSGTRRRYGHSEGPAPGALPDLGPLLATLRQSHSRDEIIHLGCEATLSVAEGAVLLAVRSDVFRGWHGLGAQVSLEAVRNLWIPRQSPSVFQEVAARGEPYAGPYGNAAADALYRAAAGAQGTHCAIRPVKVSGRTVALLVADAPSHGEAGVAQVGAVAQTVGEQLLRLLARARHGA